MEGSVHPSGRCPGICRNHVPSWHPNHVSHHWVTAWKLDVTDVARCEVDKDDPGVGVRCPGLPVGRERTRTVGVWPRPPRLGKAEVRHVKRPPPVIHAQEQQLLRTPPGLVGEALHRVEDQPGSNRIVEEPRQAPTVKQRGLRKPVIVKGGLFPVLREFLGGRSRRRGRVPRGPRVGPGGSCGRRLRVRDRRWCLLLGGAPRGEA